MTNEKNVSKVIFHPGCFDNFEGTQEELDELVKNIQELFASGDIWRGDFDITELTNEEAEEAMRGLAKIENRTRQ